MIFNNACINKFDMIRNIFFGIIIIVIGLSCAKNSKPIEISYETQIDSVLQLLTLEEKVQMIHASSSFTSGGVERLGIPEIVMSDGPHGVRHEHGRDWGRDDITTDSVSYLPTGIALASTWNRDLGYEYGAVLGNEAKARGKDMILGPGINIIRSPLCGRNFEYLSEDPYLTAEMGVGYVNGVQDQGIAACAKHYVANNQETNRKEVDVIVNEQALREIYLPAFKAVVEKADVLSIMGAYNKVRGQYCSHHEYLINDVLKGEYAFDGLVVSDWSAVQYTREALLYGTDIEMGTDLTMFPNLDYNKFFLADSALAMINSGEIAERYLDEKVRRILRVMYKTTMFGEQAEGEVNTIKHQQLALKVAEEGIVLLKNTGLLPLDENKVKSIAVIGHNAIRKHAEEGGSSQVKALYEVTPLQGLKKMLGDKVEIKFAEGYTMTADSVPDAKLLKEAIAVAKDADAVLYFGGWIHNFDPDVWDSESYDCEGNDKNDLKLLFGQDKLIQELATVNANTVVVLFGGSNVEMLNWMNNVPAIIQAWYPGMEGGTALANIIFGKTNPSGKLPMTFANAHTDYPAHKNNVMPGTSMTLNYDEGIFVGYRYFDTENVSPLFAFGHGLSYTSFDYSDLKMKKKASDVAVSFTLTNSGARAGSEVIQVYVSDKQTGNIRPEKELKEFIKVHMGAGESVLVELTLDSTAFQYYNQEQKQWLLESGVFEILIGSSSRDIRLSDRIKL